jgi:hypothetical protein
MKIQTLTVVAQHPKGLDMHLRNIRWAIDGDFDPYIFTFKAYEFVRPGINIVAVAGDPLMYYSFWRHDALEAIRNSTSDVIVISEQDVLYTTKLMPYIDQVHKTGKIVIDSEQYGHNIMKDHRVVYPRLWEGGLIVRTDVIRDAINKGVWLADFCQCHEVRDMARQDEDHYFIQIDRKISLKEMADTAIDTRFENFFEFTLYCFLNNIKTEKVRMSSHLPFPEGAHRNVPELYTGPITEEMLDELLVKSGYSHNCIPTTLLMYYLTGVCELSPLIRKIWLESDNWNKEKVRRLMPSAREWMTEEELQKLQRALNIMRPVFL